MPEAKKAPADRILRTTAALEGKLVDLTGTPLPPTSNPARFHVVYYAADGCGGWTQLTPTLTSSRKK